jgi:hypothetical protein
LDNVDQPPGLNVEIVDKFEALQPGKATLNKAQTALFGSAFLQGRRLQFTTSMPLGDYLNVVSMHRAAKGATVEELRTASNRTKIAAHEKAIREYLADTAFVSEKFIFPNFMLNYGSAWDEGMPKAKLTLLATDPETLAWPAVFETATGTKMPVTDGAHRTGSLIELIAKHQNKAGIGALLSNSVGLTIVMEASKDDAHQDFADCGRAKPIADSVLATFDMRNQVVAFARDLVGSSPFLSRHVDATSASVNLSSNSTKVWSMSAVRGYLMAAIPTDKPFLDMTAAERAAVLHEHKKPLAEYMHAVVEGVPILTDLASEKPDQTPGALRKQRGGCVLMRGAGFGVLMRAYRHGPGKTGTANGAIAAAVEKLAAVDWFVFKPGVGQQPLMDGDAYGWLKENVQPAWFEMIAVDPGKGSYRLKGTNAMIDAAFAAL